MTLWLLYLLLIALLVFGLFVNLVGLPGLWLMLGALAGFGYLTGFGVHVGWTSVIAILVLVIIAEVGEFAAGSAGAKAAGGRKRGMLGAAVGAIVGGIFLSFIPIPILGTVIGACLGAFIGAAVAEFWDADYAHALRVGYGAAKGRAFGIAIKSVIGLIMLGVAVVAACPLLTKTAAVGNTLAAPALPAAPSTGRVEVPELEAPSSTPTTSPTTIQF